MAKREILKVTTPPFIVAFPHAFVPDAMDGGTKKFSVCGIWKPAEFSEKDKANWAKIKAGLDAESRRLFKKPWAELSLEDGYKKGLRKGDNKTDYEGFGPGTIFANLTSLHRPGVCTVNGVDVSPEEGNDHLLYAGCLCRATVSFYAYEGKGKGVAIGLRNLQIVSSDEKKYPRIDGRGSASEDFDDDLDEQWLDQGDDDFGGGSEEGQDEDY